MTYNERQLTLRRDSILSNPIMLPVQQSNLANLEEWLSLQVPLFSFEFDGQLVQQLGVSVLLEVHDGLEELVDGIKHEHAETTLTTSAFFRLPLSFLLFDGEFSGLN